MLAIFLKSFDFGWKRPITILNNQSKLRLLVPLYISSLTNLISCNKYVIDSSYDDPNVEVPLSVYCLNTESFGNKAIPDYVMADYIVLRATDVLALTKTRLGTDTN